jgi:hypothetical protein
MKRFRKLRGALAAAAAGVLAVTVVAASGAGAAPSGQAHGQPSQYHQADVVFFDGFDGSSVDRSKWNVDVTRGCPEFRGTSVAAR